MTHELLNKAPAGGSHPSPESLHRRLLPWYRRQRRRLPWRGAGDPYRVWVSEVMLQQTQVATVTPFYQRFIDRFPTIARLARARAPDVLAAWSGLGYYRRARNLHAAARLVAREHAGRIPADPVRFGRLPGVGRYTVGAVLSIAFDLPLPVLDGNVARVLSRLYALPASIREPKGARALWRLAGTLVPMRRAGDWNQALMELGATVCLPRGPRCPACPVRALCRARALERVEVLPPPAPRRRTVTVKRAVALIERDGRLLMIRREGTLLDGMWEPPGVELERRASAPAALGRALKKLGVTVRLEPTGRRVRHRITHRAIEVEVWRGVEGAHAPGARVRGARFVGPRARGLALTALARKLQS